MVQYEKAKQKEKIMEINTVGSFLTYFREKYKLKKGGICSGICTTTVLAQVENGEKVVDSLEAEELLGRIGQSVLQFELILNDEDYELWCLRNQIIHEENEKHYDEELRLLKEYEKKMPKSSFHKQFCLFHKAKCALENNGSIEMALNFLYEALKQTKPEIDSGKETKSLYNSTEIEIILLLFHYKYPKWESKDKEHELLDLLSHVNRVYSKRKKEMVGIEILLELIEVEQQFEDYRRVIKYTDEAIQQIIDCRSLEYMGELRFIKAKAIKELYYNREEWAVQEENCRKECRMAYYVFGFLGQDEEKEEVQVFCEEEMGWQIIK